MPCSVSRGMAGSLETVTLENNLVRALIIAGKGGELLEFVWKRSGVNCFYRSEVPFKAYDGRDLSKNRLGSHTEMGLGGWMTVLPHRAKYGGIELTQETGGVAATVPWTIKNISESGEAASVTLFADLPVIPMHVEKTFTLRDGSAELAVDESVFFHGDSSVEFTWTEHALFGNGFVDESTTVIPPSDTVFDAWAHMAAPDAELSRFEHPVSAVPLKGCTYDLRRPLPSGYGGSEFIVFKDCRTGEAALRNERLGLSVSLKWDVKRFPYMRSLYRSDSAVVVGLEPGDDLFSGFGHSLGHGTYTKMNPGDKISTGFKLAYANIQ